MNPNEWKITSCSKFHFHLHSLGFHVLSILSLPPLIILHIITPPPTPLLFHNASHSSPHHARQDSPQQRHAPTETAIQALDAKVALPRLADPPSRRDHSDSPQYLRELFPPHLGRLRQDIRRTGSTADTSLSSRTSSMSRSEAPVHWRSRPSECSSPDHRLEMPSFSGWMRAHGVLRRYGLYRRYAPLSPRPFLT